MATLENRGNGSWRITVSGGYGPDGKQIRVKKTIKVDPSRTLTAQRKEAEKEAAALETDYRRHQLTAGKKVKLSTLADEYIESKNITPTTIAGYRVLLDRRILPALGSIPVQDLTVRQLRAFFNDLKTCEPFSARAKDGKLSGNAQLHYYRLLNAILNFAVKSQIITFNPMTGVDAPRKEVKETEHYEPEECAAMLDALDRLDDPMWKLFFLMALYTSCRPGELIGADWQDIKGNIFTVAHGSAFIKGKGTIRTPQPKTAKSVRQIVLPAEVMHALQAWKSEQAAMKLRFGGCWPEESKDAIFTGNEGHRVHINTPTQRWPKFCKANNLRQVPLYALRHTGASLLIAEGIDARSVAARLGHSTPTLTLNTYAHAFANAQARTTEAITNALKTARAEAK